MNASITLAPPEANDILADIRNTASLNYEQRSRLYQLIKDNKLDTARDLFAAWRLDA